MDAKIVKEKVTQDQYDRMVKETDKELVDLLYTVGDEEEVRIVKHLIDMPFSDFIDKMPIMVNFLAFTNRPQVLADLVCMKDYYRIDRDGFVAFMSSMLMGVEKFEEKYFKEKILPSLPYFLSIAYSEIDAVYSISDMLAFFLRSTDLHMDELDLSFAKCLDMDDVKHPDVPGATFMIYAKTIQLAIEEDLDIMNALCTVVDHNVEYQKILVAHTSELFNDYLKKCNPMYMDSLFSTISQECREEDNDL